MNLIQKCVKSERYPLKLEVLKGFLISHPNSTNKYLCHATSDSSASWQFLETKQKENFLCGAIFFLNSCLTNNCFQLCIMLKHKFVF